MRAGGISTGLGGCASAHQPATQRVLATAAAAGVWAARGLQQGWKHVCSRGCHGAGSVPAAGDGTLLCWRAISALQHSWLFHTRVLAARISDKVVIQYTSGRCFVFFPSGIVFIFLAPFKDGCCRVQRMSRLSPGVPACRFWQGIGATESRRERPLS